MLRHFIQEKIILPISDFLTGQQVAKYLKFMLQSQTWTREQIDEFQNKRLRLLITYAFNNVPFYHDIMIQRGLTPKDIQTKKDLSKLPIINKDIMRKEGIERFTSTSMPKTKMQMRSSSGSTGQPFKYYSTKLSYSVNIAANLRGWYNFGWRLGDKYVKISQNPRKNILKKLQDWITGNMYIATSNLSDKHLFEIMKQIERYKPVVIRSYPDPLYIMAQFRLQHQDEFQYSPKVITTTGNILHKNIRQTIEKAFGCPIYDAYACEGNANVFECSTHFCYHSSEEYSISEIVDEQDNPIVHGTGRLIATDLWNFAHPFIRYDVQDRVEIETTPCPCGNKHLQIKKIWGRDNEVLVTKSGKRYIVHHFTVFFEPTVTKELNDSVDQFQITQHCDGSITFKLVVNDRYTQQIETYLRNYWEKELEAPVTIEIVQQIPIMHNNKRKFIIIEKAY